MGTVTVSEKGQVVIPADLRRLLGITAGTRLEFHADGAGFRADVNPAGKSLDIDDVIGCTGYKGVSINVNEMRVSDYPKP
ncbi:MAG: AbrB/MazE/SpoVT family DNA-binding domain-containing protein [Methylophilaceae bacterium]